VTDRKCQRRRKQGKKKKEKRTIERNPSKKPFIGTATGTLQSDDGLYSCCEKNVGAGGHIQIIHSSDVQVVH